MANKIPPLKIEQGSNRKAKRQREILRMSSDEITRQIIKTIVNDSITVLKSIKTLEYRPEQPNSVEQLNPQVKEMFSQLAPLEPSQVTETMAAFIMRAVVLNPNYAIRIENELTQDQVQELIRVGLINVALYQGNYHFK